jgi:YHS domain-containing protein
VTLDEAGLAKLNEFLDTAIERFFRDYLEMHAPESPYQKSALVADPVCGMVFPKSEAAVTGQQAGRTFYFCSTHCRDRFMADPARGSKSS